MDELTTVGAVFAFALGVMLFGTNCGDDDAGELDGRDPGVEAEQLDALPPAPVVDCRPVRVDGCSSWNDRACFHVPHECATPLIDTGRE